MSKKNYSDIATALIHGGIYGDKTTGAVNVPIYQTSTYEQISLGKHTGYEYSRTGNPTREALEALIAELEGGNAGFAFASGMAAITAVLSLFQSGDKIIISSNVYGGTFRVLDKIFKNFGISYSIEDTTDLEALNKKITKEVKAIYIESPANPLMTITDLEEVANLAKNHGILSIVDNTFMTPYLQRPIEFGIDIVLHSATKYLGGHSDLIAGLVVVNRDDLKEKIAFIQNATGGILQPFDSFLLIRGIKTLGVRLDRHVENAKHIADYLSNHEAVKKVYYPGLKNFPGYEINKKQAKNGGAMLAFELHENYDIRKFFEKLRLVALAESLGGVESLVCHPASMTHASIPYEIRQKVGITEGLIRLSVGIEKDDEIIADLAQAIQASKEN
jgi:cysteine-S-conjugate beta-lyase